jgi:uncharacterized protein
VTPESNSPDYQQLVKFLFRPFLSEADNISIDCEYTLGRRRVSIRVAVAEADRETAIGRGGRNLQAIRTVLQVAATAAGQTLSIDVYGSTARAGQSDSSRSTESSFGDRRPPRNNSRPQRDRPQPPRPRRP